MRGSATLIRTPSAREGSASPLRKGGLRGVLTGRLRSRFGGAVHKRGRRYRSLACGRTWASARAEQVTKTEPRKVVLLAALFESFVRNNSGDRLAAELQQLRETLELQQREIEAMLRCSVVSPVWRTVVEADDLSAMLARVDGKGN